jgi:hypothetical protein
MRKTIKLPGIIALVAIIGLIGACDLLDEIEGASTTVNIAAILGVTPPAAGEVPATSITETLQYTGTVTWIPTVTDTFALSTAYIATITLTAKPGFTLKGVTANFFTIAGATSVANAEDSGIITAIFPLTGATFPDPINIAAIPGVTPPVRGATPVTAITETAQYIGSVTWSPPVSGTFAASTLYTATITLTAKPGFTLQGVAANFFTIAGTTSIENTANSGSVKAVFLPTEAAPTGGNNDWSSFPMYQLDSATGLMTPFVPEGDMKFFSLEAGLFRCRNWEDPNEFQLPAEIVNNRLVFDLPFPVPFASLHELDDMLDSSAAQEVRGVSIMGFGNVRFCELEGEEVYTMFILVNKNNLSDIVGFTYVNRDTKITGIDYSDHYDLDLKQGWNTVKYDIDRATNVNFTPDANFVWLTGDFMGYGDGDMGEWHDGIIKISGTINISVNGQFPAGGFKLEAFHDGGVGIIDRPTGSITQSWSFDFSDSDDSWGGFSFLKLTIYPDADRQIFYEYYPGTQTFGTLNKISENEWGRPLYEVTDRVLRPISITTITVPVSIAGTLPVGNITIYADSYPFSDRHGMFLSGRGPRNFLLPNDLGLSFWGGDKNWLWFNLVTDQGQSYISRGRLDASSPVVLNISQMYLEPAKPTPPGPGTGDRP